MTLLLLLLLLVPVVITGAAFFLGKRRITPREVLLQLGVLLALVYGGWLLARLGAIRDTEIWNGRVARKDQASIGCCHSYECNCHESCSGTGSERSCSTHCDTCYEHDEDVKWTATSTNAEVVYSNSCNPPGTPVPAEWSRIVVGEPTAWEHGFTNYVLADPAAVLGDLAELDELRARVPAYPRVDGFRAPRFLYVGLTEPPHHVALAELNAELGPKQQVNLIVIVAAERDPRYFDAVRAEWLGGKKNDVVLVVGAPEFPAIAWAKVMAWNQSAGAEDDFVGVLSARIEQLGRFDPDLVLSVLREEVSGRYVRRPFSELAWLWERARPSRGGVALLFFAELLLSALLTLFFWKNRHVMEGDEPATRVGRLLRRLRGRGPPPPPPEARRPDDPPGS